MLDADCKTLLGAIKIRYFIESPEFPRLGPLAVVYVKEREPVAFMRDRGRDATVHAAAHKHDCEVFFHAVSLPAWMGNFYRII
jgi:hypothetical protein